MSWVTVTGIAALPPLGLIYLTPLFLGHVRGFIAWQIGGAILWAGPFQLATVPIYSFLANRVDLRLLLMIGLVCCGLLCHIRNDGTTHARGHFKVGEMVAGDAVALLAAIALPL
jgi:hypothetical protein